VHVHVREDPTPEIRVELPVAAVAPGPSARPPGRR
jgi:hypothetical protein